MLQPENIVSIHPYFRVNPGKMTEAKDLLRQMVARTSSESANLYYDFTINGDVFASRSTARTLTSKSSKFRWLDSSPSGLYLSAAGSVQTEPLRRTKTELD